jgi:hypothetical protein
MWRWGCAGLGLLGFILPILWSQEPGIAAMVAFLAVGMAVVWITSKYPWLLGLALMILPFMGAVAQYPLSHKLICQRTPPQSKSADCYVKLRHISGWGDDRQDYRAVKQAKTIRVNAISSYKQGGKRKRSAPVPVLLYPLFLTDRQNQSRKLEEFGDSESNTTPVMNQINQFLAGEQSRFTINLLDKNSGSTNPTQQEYVLYSLFQILMLGGVGAIVVLKSLANYLRTMIPEEEQS